MDNLIKQLRIVGMAEGTSFLVLLFVAMPLKYFAGYPIAVTIAGSIHGFLFILYCVALARAASSLGWNMGKNIEVFIAAIYPFGTFILDPKLKKEEQEIKAQSGSSAGIEQKV